MALASNRFTAEVAARYGRGPVAIAPGEEGLYLSRLPLAALPLPAELARRLAPLGLETLGDFASLPVAAVESRYGPEGVALHRLARGEDGRGLLPARAPRPWQVHHELLHPAGRLEDLRPALDEGLHRLVEILREQGLAATRVVLEVRLDAPPEGPGCTRWEVSPAAPEERPELLLQLLELRLADQPPGAPVRGLVLEASGAAAPDVHQGALFDGPRRDPGRRAEALSRLACVLGEQAVAPVGLRPDHRLEERWGRRPTGRAGGARRGAGKGRPASRPVLRMLQPAPELVPVLAGGRLVAFRRGRQQLEIARLSAPRRLEGGWWSRPWARDEHDLLTRDGAWLRICRDLGTHRWRLLAEVD
jgi:hypothetical protein